MIVLRSNLSVNDGNLFEIEYVIISLVFLMIKNKKLKEMEQSTGVLVS